MLPRIVVEQVGRGLADALAQASGGLPELARFHLPSDGFRLLQRLVPRFHGEHGLQSVGAPVVVAGVDFGEDVALEMHHVPLVAGIGQQFARRRYQSGAPVADRQSHALEAACDHAGDERAPAFRVLLHAIAHSTTQFAESAKRRIERPDSRAKLSIGYPHIGVLCG